MKRMHAVMAVLVIVFISACISPAKRCTNVSDIVSERVPYQVQEAYYEMEPFVYYLSREVLNTTVTKSAGKAAAMINVKNTDKEEGFFTAMFEFTSSSGSSIVNDRKPIKPGGNYTFVLYYDNSGNDVRGDIIFLQSDPMTGYSNVTKYRTVTKYVNQISTRNREVCQ